MAATLVFIYLGKIGEGFMSGIGGCLVAPIKQQFKYLCCFDSHITELQTKLRDLEATRKVVQEGAEEIHRQARDVRSDIVAWLKRVNEVTTEVEGLIQDMEKVEEGCLNGWCSNLKLRYSLSRQAVTETEDLIHLRDVGDQYTQTLPSHRSPRPGLDTITNKDFTGFESRRLTMEEIIKALKHDEINLIGVCGMGGVGKTTMVNEVAKRAKEDNLFDEVAIAVVGQEQNLTNVQVCIADMLGLKNLRDTESPIMRADLLRKRLLDAGRRVEIEERATRTITNKYELKDNKKVAEQKKTNKKVLVILDDIWAEFDLKAMGIPLEGADKNFKVLYTSRTQDLWHDLRTKKEIPLEILSKDEAWQLFREKAGDSADAPDLQPIAKQIVDECGCLPLALVLFGSALSKKSGRNATKKIWEGILGRLTCAGSTPADKDLSSRLALSYEFLEDEQKRLFLLCCLFSEDENIRIEDLARYGLGLSLFDGIPEMEKVRPQVFLIVDDLKSRYLLLDGKNKEEECVKVHDVVHDMGLYVASKFALVIHGEVSEWPKKDTYEDHTSISLVSRKITELPKRLTCPNLEFLLLDCTELKEIPCQFFEGMGKLKVLVLKNFKGILALPSSSRNLHTLSLPFFHGELDNVSEFGGLFNLKTLSFRGSCMEELPKEIGELDNLRLLDLTYTVEAKRIPPGVISRLTHLEELYALSNSLGDLWEGEGNEEEGRNANLSEFALLSNLSTLEIFINGHILIPKSPIFEKLEIYKVVIVDGNRFNHDEDCLDDLGFIDEDGLINEAHFKDFVKEKCERVLWVQASIPIPSDRGGIDSLLRSSDWLCLRGEGCNDLVRELLLRDGVNGLQQKKVLEINQCDTPEWLANTTNPVHLPTAPAPHVFPILKDLHLRGLVNLREICCGPVPAGSFGELTSIRVDSCQKLENLFQLEIVGCLTRLEELTIWSCDMMAEVFWKDQQEEVHVATNNRIEFPKLKTLTLGGLPSLEGFCIGIDQIDFPQLKHLELRLLGQYFSDPFDNNCNLSSNSEQNDNDLSSNSEQNDNVGFLSIFPQKVSLPNLEVLEVDELENLERLGHGSLSVGSLSKLKEFTVTFSHKLLCVFPSQLLSMLRDLQELTVEYCDSLEVVFELEGLESKEPNPEILSPLKFVKLRKLPKLNCISKSDPMVFKYIQTLEICDCKSLRYVFAPTMTKSIPQLQRLKISSCKMLSRIVAEENGLGESSVDEVEFPHLESLELLDLPNLVSFFPNVNVNTTTLAKSTDHLHNPMQPQPLFNEKVAFPGLKYMGLSGLQNVIDLWGSELPTSSFSKLEKLEVGGCVNLRNVFYPSMAVSFLNLQELVINDCLKMEGVVDRVEEEEEERQGTKIDKTLYTQLIILKLDSPEIYDSNSLRCVFAPTMPKSIPQLRKLKISRCEMLSGIVAKENGLGESSVDEVEFPQFESCGLLDLANFVSFFPNVNVNVNTPTLAKSTDHNHNPLQPQPVFNEQVAQLLYTDNGKGVLALRSNGTMTLWKWENEQDSFRKATASAFPHHWQPDNGLAMTNDVIGVNLEEAVPCMALAKYDHLDNYIISACGGAISLFDARTLKVLRTFMPPPPASTFLAFYSREYTNIVAIGMEDSTIRIYNFMVHEVKSELKGHKKRITGLAFSTNLNILVSSGADAKLCIWSTDTWEHLKSVPIQVPACKDCNDDTRVEFHSDQIRLLVSHETQLAIYDASEMYRICQWITQDVLPAPISFAAYSCDSQLVYTSFCDGKIGVFDAHSLTLTHRIAPSIYLSPAMLSGSQVVYPRVLAAHPQKCNQFAIGLTNGSVILIEPQKSEGKWGLSPTVDNGMLNDRTASSSNTSYHTPDQVARLLYTNSGNDVIALRSNGTMTLGKWDSSQHNPSGEATASVFPQLWRLASRLAMTNDVTGVNLEEAVPCMALSKNESYIISACGGRVSILPRVTFRVMTMFMPPPPASTFLAFYPQDNNIIAIGMEDSTIRIYNVRVEELISELKGHKKRITGLTFSTELNKLVSSGADAQLCIWSIDTWEKLKSVPIQLSAGTACNGDTRVQFHSDQIRLLVSHETQLAIYDASKMDCIRQWVPQDVLPAPISFAAYSCDCQLVYTSFCDGNIGVFDADSFTLTCRIVPSVYLSPTMLSGGQAVYPRVVAAHPEKPNQFAIGLTQGSVIVMEPPESEGKWGLSSSTIDNGMLNDRTTSSSNTSNHTPDQNQRKEEEEDKEDADEEVYFDLYEDVDEDKDMDEDEEDQEEKRKKEKGKAPQSG